jgi:3-methyladenine DNA glycosylase AlkC
MRFISEYGYTVKLGQEEAYQKWMQENESALAASHPEGVKYLGTFTMIFSSEKQSGFYKTYLELDSYAALDRLAEANKDANSEFSRLLRESSRFGDYDLAAPWSNGLYKAVVDATIFDPAGS